MLVEFVGVPGVGKSTLTRLASEHLGTPFRHVNLNVDGPERHVARFAAAVTNPRLMRMLVRGVFHVPPGPAVAAALHLLPRLGRQRRLPSFTIVDSGAVFAGAAVVRDGGVPPQQLASVLPAPDVVVHLDAPLEETVRRVRRRARPHPILRMDDTGALRHMQLYDAAIRRLLADLPSRVVTVPTTGRSAEEATADAVANIRGLLPLG
jgi:shikimate kinase